MQNKKENNVVNIGHNANEVSKESYEKLARNFKNLARHVGEKIYEIRHSFDEAFTKHEHSNPHSRKLKDFEIHEKRDEAKQYCIKTRKELQDEIEALESGVLKYGIDIRDKDEEENTNE
jgi:uncharacterized membrane protein YgaE (UPF0421/DUF939 family)